jgi:hypothetical protein
VAERLFTRYARRLIGLAEQRLSRALAGHLDGEDVVQSVFRMFFRRSATGAFRVDSSAGGNGGRPPRSRRLAPRLRESRPAKGTQLRA